MRSLLGGKVELHEGDCTAILPTLPAGSIDACVTDPPYHLLSIVKRFANSGGADRTLPKKDHRYYRRLSKGFMGKRWDGGDVAFRADTWRAVHRVLKPGSHLVAFGAPKNWHRLAVAIEDAGFEIRDGLQWLFGSGFPKSHSLALALEQRICERRTSGWHYLSDGEPMRRKPPFRDPDAQEWGAWGTALKPAWEPIILARRPLEGTNAENAVRYGVGGLNIDGCRVATGDDLNGGAYAEVGGRRVSGSLHAGTGMNVAGKTVGSEFVQPDGRWPANVVHDGSPEVLAAFPDSSGGHWSGETPSLVGRQRPASDEAFDQSDGSAARFFFSAKADADDRIASKHPTVKPVDLMRWLCRLITPRGGVVLDPFAGTGSTAEAAFYEGFRSTLIEAEPEYIADIERRMKLALAGEDEKRFAIVKARGLADDDPGPLFSR